MGTGSLSIFYRVKEFIFPDDVTEEHKATIRIMRVIFLFILLGLSAILIVNLIWNEKWLNIAIPISFAVFLGIWIIMERGHVQLSMLLVAVVMDGMATYGGTYGHGLHDIAIVVFPGTIIITSLILNRRNMIILNGITIIMVAWLGYSEKIESLPRLPIIPGNMGDIVFVTMVIIGASLWAMLISEQNRRNLKQVRYNATHDYLTGCPNRALLFDRIDQVIRKQKRDPDLNFAILFFDLDGFKNINDTLGHRNGDELIVSVARRIQAILRDSDTIARIGGDEFILLLSQVQSLEDALLVAERVQEEIQKPFDLVEKQVSLSASIGIVFGNKYENADQLLIDADLAMYKAKSLGKAQYQVFENSMRSLLDNGMMSLSLG